MSTDDRASEQPAELEVRWNRRSLWRSILVLVLFFVAYIAITVFASGALRLIGMVGAIVFGAVLACAGLASAWQIHRSAVVATMNEFGVTFDRHDPAAWETFREVRLVPARPRLLFKLRPLYYIAFLPKRTGDLPRPAWRERFAIRMYGTSLLLLTQTVSPAKDDILAAVQRFSDVPVRRQAFAAEPSGS